MSEETVLIRFDWDSGPYNAYSEVTDSKSRLPDVSPVPRPVWERYNRAVDELRAAEDALYEAKGDNDGEG